MENSRVNKIVRETGCGPSFPLEALVSAMLAWFESNARDLPWRSTRDPYAIWVSEVMLQQTQVKTVIPFWERWMKRLPTVRSLARARSHTIHKLWEGLGYYTRVRNMQRAARVIVREYDGKFPETFEDVLALPGIGRYTAGAICSIAFNQPLPILDGNVARVLSRIFAIHSDPRGKAVNHQLWLLADDLVQTASVGGESNPIRGKAPWTCSALNQSLMELGALICTPKEPKCDTCPVHRHCLAYQRGLTDRLPSMKRRPLITPRRFVAFIIAKRNKILVRQRPEGVVNAHLWEFPNVEITGCNGHSRRSACAAFKIDSESLRPLCRIKHSITRYRITLEAYQAKPPARGSALTTTGTWLPASQLGRLAFASAHKKILEKFLPQIHDPRNFARTRARS